MVAMLGVGSTNQVAGQGTYILASWVFLRLLGFIYLVAFVSLALQIKGLIGQRGIMPAVEFLHGRKHWGRSRFWRSPTLCWLNSSDGFLLLLDRKSVV